MNITLGGALEGHQPSSFSISHTLNLGWSATLDFPYLLDHTGIAADATATITWSDEQDTPISMSTPPMILRTRGRKASLGGLGTRIELIDLTSHKLSSGSESFDTFENTTSTAIVAAIATRFGVSISGATAFDIWKEDIKLSNGWVPLQRIAVVAGQQLVVTDTGAVQFVDNDWTVPGALLADDEEESDTPGEMFGKIFVSKNLGMGTAIGPWYFDFDEGGYPSTVLDPQISAAVPNDVTLGGNGSITMVGFWDAEDKLIELHSLGGTDIPIEYSGLPEDGTWPAVRFTCLVTPDPDTGVVEARLQISGTPPDPVPAGIDPAFAQTYGTGRGLTSPFQESLIPSEAWADDHWEDWLRELNRGKRTLKVTGPMDCSVGVGVVHVSSLLSLSGRAEKVTWSGGTSSPPKTTMEVELTSG